MFLSVIFSWFWSPVLNKGTTGADIIHIILIFIHPVKRQTYSNQSYLIHQIVGSLGFICELLILIHESNRHPSNDPQPSCGAPTPVSMQWCEHYMCNPMHSASVEAHVHRIPSAVTLSRFISPELSKLLCTTFSLNLRWTLEFLEILRKDIKDKSSAVLIQTRPGGDFPTHSWSLGDVKLWVTTHKKTSLTEVSNVYNWCYGFLLNYFCWEKQTG